MNGQTGTRGRIPCSVLTRRRLLHGSIALGGGIHAGPVLVSARAHARQDQNEVPLDTSVSGNLTSWGFGVEETNPLAFARVDAFREAYSNVDLEVVPEFDNQKLLTAAASGTVPDLLWLDRFQIASWAARGVLMPLDPFIEEDGYDLSRFYEVALNEATYQGNIYGIPGGMDVRGLYVNLDALAEIGVNVEDIDTSDWEQLSELGAELVQRDGDRVDRWGFDHKLQAGHLPLWGPANGGSFLAGDGQEATFDDPALVDALAWGVDAYDVQGGFQDYEAFATTWQGDEQFARGQVAMTVYENWMLGLIARVMPDLNFAVLPLRERGGEGLTSFTGGRAWCIPQGAENPEAAWEFIKFMHTDETWLIGARAVKAARQAGNEPYIPSLTGSKTADQLQIEELYEPIAPKFDDAVRLWPQILEESHNREFSQSPVGDQLADILQQEGVMPALRQDRTPEEALATADELAQDAIDSF